MKRKLLEQKLRRIARQARKTREQSINRTIHRAILGVSPLRAAYPLVKASMAYDTFMQKALLDDLERVISNAFGVPAESIKVTPAGNKDAFDRQYELYGKRGTPS